MRPLVQLGLTLTLFLPLAGCGDTWWNPPLTGGYNPHMPVVDSDNMRRVMGQDAPTAALESEPGDVWPGPLPPTPTLSDLENPNGQSQNGAPPAMPEDQPRRGSTALPAPNPARGSSTPPAAPPSPPPLALTPPARPNATVPPAPAPTSGQVIPLGTGQAVTTGGGPGYQTTTTPGGGSAIVVPNGNGTSTVIHSDGRIETIPTPPK